MKVLYLHQHFSTPDGSGGTRSYEFSRALIEKGHQVTLVCGRGAGTKRGSRDSPSPDVTDEVVDGIRVISLPLPYSNYDSLLKRAATFFRFAWRSIGIAMREDYDLLFATSTPLTAGIPGIVTKALRRKPFVFEVRDLWPELPKAMGVVTNPAVLAAMSALEWLSYRCSDACIGLSPGIMEGIRRRSSRTHPIKLIPNGCDLTLFQPVRPPAQAFPGTELGDFVAVFTGAHGVANGLNAVLDAAAVLVHRGRRNIRLVFVGDGKLKPKLMERAARDKLVNCLFLDPMPKRWLAEAIPSANVGLMILANIPAFYYGTSPNKFFDYIAAGLPVLTNYPGWLSDLVRDHGCGVGVPPGNPEAFADALERLAESPGLCVQMGGNARRLAERAFDRARLAEDFIACLEQHARC